jgi:hypothetical protein
MYLCYTLSPPKAVCATYLSSSDRNGHVQTGRRDIYSNYLTGWFAVDLISSLPFDNMTTDSRLGVLKAFRVGYDAPSY